MKKLKISTVVTSLFIGFLFILLLSKVISVSQQVVESETYSREHIYTLDLINEIRSSLAHLSLWQLAYTTDEDESERYTAQRRIDHLSEQIVSISDSISTSEIIDSVYLERLSISVQQLLEANSQVIAAQSMSDDVIVLDSLNIDYRSVFDILNFHLNTVQELTIRKMNQRSRSQYSHLLAEIIIEIVIISIIALIIIGVILSRKRTEQLLSETESYFNDVVNSSPSALIGVRQDGTVFQMNRMARELSNVSSEIEGSVDTYFTDFSCMDDLKQAIQEERSFTQRESILLNNTQKVFVITTFPFTSSDRQGSVLRIEEISDQARMEEELRQTQKMNAIGQLAGGIAHDFNNTLGAIKGATELLLFDCNNDEEKSYIYMISDATDRAAELTTKLLTFARKNHRDKMILKMDEVISSTEVLIRHSINKSISIDLDLTADNHSIKGDYGELQNLLLNLGINAHHAMVEGGSIIIGTENVRFESKECSTLPFNPIPGDYLQISVSDTGTGISPSNLERIFEPFFTTKEHGTGIGLSSAYGTIQEHRGTIAVNSELGEGTTFKIYFPLSGPKQISNNRKHQQLTSGEGTILVADDEPIIRRTLSLMLNRLGYTVILATNGVEAVELFKKDQEQIDLIILDMIMPVMNGLGALKEIRNIDVTIPVIISSGFAQSEDMEQAKKLHVSEVLSKPFSGQKLGTSVASALKETIA